MNLNDIFENKLVRGVMLSKLKKVIKDNNLSLVSISLDKNGELDIKFYSEEMKILPKKDFDETIKLITL